MHALKLFFYTLLYFILIGCANIQPPTGGPKDMEPPVITSQIPKENQINYTNPTIDLIFDEQINVQNIQEQLLITPLTDIEYEATVRRNRLIIDFKESLAENTTYTLNFRQAIKDVTENNIAENLKFAFSTGPYIDSIKVEGRVTDLLTNQPLPSINVSLYNAEDTLNIQNSRPLYLAKTDQNGNYTITNIKNGYYDIYALEDKSSTMLYEKENERIAFRKNIDLTEDKSGIDLSVARFVTTPPIVNSTSSIDNKVRIVFSRGIESLDLVNLEDTTHTLYYNPGEDGRTFTVYNTVGHQDSIDFSLTATDSSLIVLKDTVRVAFDTRKKELKEEVIRNIRPTNQKLSPSTPEIEILFSNPIVSALKDSINITIDTTNLTIDNQNINFNKYRNILRIENLGSFRDSIILNLHAQSFINVTGDTSRSRQMKFTSYNGEDLGLISGRVETDDENFIIELLNTKYQILDTIVNSNTFHFPYLEPGQYQLRYIKDTNGNQRWDSGNLTKQRQPEPVIFYRETISVRANWEIRDLVFDARGKKEQ